MPACRECREGEVGKVALMWKSQTREATGREYFVACPRAPNNDAKKLGMDMGSACACACGQSGHSRGMKLL